MASHVADRLTGNFKMALLILLSIATLSYIWFGFIVMKYIPFSMGELYFFAASYK